MNYEGKGLQEVKVKDKFYEAADYAILRDDWINAMNVSN